MTVFSHEVRVRYGECDMQGVVFNANYLAYIDDAVDRWVRTSIARSTGRDSDGLVDLHDIGFDFMVKSVALTFNAPVSFGDVVNLECQVVRWGRTSFDVKVSGSVAGVLRFEALLVYVSVEPSVNTPIATPEIVKTALAG